MMKHLFSRRILAMTLLAVLVLGGTPVTAMGTTTNGVGGEITGFDTLPSSTANQEVEVGTALSDLMLPDTLMATVRLEILIQEKDPEEPIQENIAGDADEEASAEVTSGSAIRMEVRQDSEEMEFIETTVSIPVTWEAEPEFDSETPGSYVFVPELPPEYTLAEYTEIPAITVTVTNSTVSDTLIPVDGGTVSTMMALASGTGWTLDDDGTLTVSSNMGMSDWSVYKYFNTEYAAQVERVVIESGVTSISGGAFYNCTNLTQITIPDSVTSIGQQAFRDCRSLESVTLPPLLATIEVQMFQGCSSLGSIIIPESVTLIRNYAFDGCSALTQVTIPDSVEEISVGAFSGCAGLTEVTFESAETPVIGTTIFNACSSLAAIYVPAVSVDAYKTAENMSIYADKINPVIRDTGWTLDADGKLTITSDAGMANWSSIYVFDAVRSAVKTVDIRSGVTNIGDMAFYNCSSLTEIEIPASVNSIGFNAFYSCSALTAIEIPSAVTNIDEYVFANCEALQMVTFESATPPTVETEIFYNCSNLAAIYVPAGSAGAYKAIPNLDLYKHLIVVSQAAVTNTAGAGSVTYNGSAIDLTEVSGLFTVDSNAGARTYTVETGGTGAGTTSGGSLTVTKAGTIRIGLETAETDTHQAGLKVIGTLTVSKGRQSAPAGLDKADVTTYGGSDGKITGLTANARYEYKKDSGSYAEVAASASGEITGLTAGSYVVRFAANDLYNASQDSIEITIGQASPQSSEKSVTGVTVPGNATISGSVLSANVTNSVTSQTVNLTVSAGASWALYSDAGCQNEISNKTMTLNTGANIAYVKVKAEDGTVQVYTVTIIREAVPQSSAKAVMDVTAPSGAVINGNIITATVANSVTSQAVNLTVSAGASWALYSDAGCRNEISNKTMNLSKGANTAYMKVTAEDGTTQVYTITVTRKSGGSGGSSSSGGHSSSSSSPKTVAPVTGTAENKAAVDNKGNASATITDKNITDAVVNANATAEKQGKSAGKITVSINVSMAGRDANTVTVNLPITTQQQVISNKIAAVELTIDRPDIVLGLNNVAITEINKQANADVQLTAAKIDSTKLSAAAKNAIGSRPAFDFKATYQKGKGSVTDFGKGTVYVSIPYTPVKNEKVGYLYAVYVDDKGNVSRVPGSAYDVNTQSIMFATNHFSVYGVSYTDPTVRFTDTSSHWAKDSIDYVVGRGLLTETSETTFSPDAAMTRGTLATALGRLAGVEEKNYKTNSFTDVKADSTYRPYIEWAYGKSIIQGIGNSQFAPDRVVTREEIAVIFANYAKATGYTLPAIREVAVYADASAIGTNYNSAVTAMQQAGIMMGGNDNKFNPKSSATRAEVSSMLHRYIKLTINPATAQGWAMNDAGQYLYYKDGKTLTGFWELGTNGNNKTYYFAKDGIMAADKWLRIDGKWYYFSADGSLEKSTKVDGYEVDENGVRKTK